LDLELNKEKYPPFYCIRIRKEKKTSPMCFSVSTSILVRAPQLVIIIFF
jgi:hypothetical protein